MSRSKFEEFDQHTYHMPAVRHLHLPLKPIGEQTPWDANIRNIIRRQISRLCCEDKVKVEGVRVMRSAAFSKCTYTIGRDKTFYTLDEAVDKVIEVMSDRERGYLK